MSTTTGLLEHLTRDELMALAGKLQLPFDSRTKKDELLKTLTYRGAPRLNEFISELSRERLKQLCRKVGVDDRGREKATIAARLLASGAPVVRAASVQFRLAGVDESDAGECAPSARIATPAVPPIRTKSPERSKGKAMTESTGSDAITLPVLEAHLWEAANILRGSPVDRTDWKSYILPLLFFKRICDVWDEEHAAMLADYGEDYADEHRFQVPEGCHWLAVRGTPKNVGTALANAMRGVEAANQKHLYGVFGDAQWTNKDRLPDELLKDLIEHFSALSIGNARVASDVMGDAYEYLIKQFADSTNKKAGEFYTPRSVVRLIVDILDPKEGETIYDPACGTGGMLLAAVDHVRARGGDPRTFFGKLHGQEKNLTTRSRRADEPLPPWH